jgi:hypothetical protein
LVIIWSFIQKLEIRNLSFFNKPTRLATGLLFKTKQTAAVLFGSGFVHGFDAFGAGPHFFAGGQGGRLQIRLLLSFGGGVEFGRAQAHPAPSHHSGFFAQLANFGHRIFINKAII